MRYVALFCHAYKNKPTNDKFRIVYKIYDPASGKFASVYRGPVRRSVEASSNTPHCMAVMSALLDPYLDTIKPDTFICIFNTHRLIHTVIEGAILNRSGNGDNATPKFKAISSKLKAMIDRTRTVSCWLQVKDELNPLRDVLSEFMRFNKSNEGEWTTQDTYCSKEIRDATDCEFHIAVTKYYDHIMKAKNQRDLFDSVIAETQEQPPENPPPQS